MNETEPKLPNPVGYVTMETPSGAPDGVKWTGWALAHGGSLYSIMQMEEAILAERTRCARLVELYANVLDKNIIGGIGDSARTLAKYIRNGAEALE